MLNKGSPAIFKHLSEEPRSYFISMRVIYLFFLKLCSSHVYCKIYISKKNGLSSNSTLLTRLYFFSCIPCVKLHCHMIIVVDTCRSAEGRGNDESNAQLLLTLTVKEVTKRLDFHSQQPEKLAHCVRAFSDTHNGKVFFRKTTVGLHQRKNIWTTIFLKQMLAEER